MAYGVAADRTERVYGRVRVYLYSVVIASPLITYHWFDFTFHISFHRYFLTVMKRGYIIWGNKARISFEILKFLMIEVTT